MPHRSPRQRPAVTVDIVVFFIRDDVLSVLLIKRKKPPFQNMWAVPGGFVGYRESLEDAARRELKEETGVEPATLEQLYTFGQPDRDPRTRVVTVVYFTVLREGRSRPRAGSDAREVSWFPALRLPSLAFDHRQILRYAVERLRNKLSYTVMGFQFLPPKFTLTELQKVYEIVFDRRLDKRNFRKKVLSARLLRPCAGSRAEGAHRPARLYAPKPRIPFLLESTWL